jgi:nucleoside-diphosphate-sugar epimerase
VAKSTPRAPKVLVAGGAGFVGSHLVELLLDDGCEVTVVDSFCTSSRRNLEHLRREPRLRVVRQDVRSPVRGGFERIYHLASPASPVDYGRDGIHTLLTNAVGTHRLLELARDTGARFLLASTSEVYGDPLVHPQRETYTGNVDPIGPRSAYDEGKRFAEALVVAYVRQHRVDARIVRIFNAYGPRMRPHDGRMPSAFIAAGLRGEPIPVHGRGRQTRSLCFVGDTARGLIAAMERGRPGEVYNIGRPDEISVLDFARAVQQATGAISPIAFVPGRPQDIRRRKPEISKARRELDWRPETTLDAGLPPTIAYFARELDLPEPLSGWRARSPRTTRDPRAPRVRLAIAGAR